MTGYSVFNNSKLLKDLASGQFDSINKAVLVLLKDHVNRDKVLQAMQLYAEVYHLCRKIGLINAMMRTPNDSQFAKPYELSEVNNNDDEATVINFFYKAQDSLFDVIDQYALTLADYGETDSRTVQAREVIEEYIDHLCSVYYDMRRLDLIGNVKDAVYGTTESEIERKTRHLKEDRKRWMTHFKAANRTSKTDMTIEFIKDILNQDKETANESESIREVKE